MITGIHIAIVFDDRNVTAGGAKEAQGVVLAKGGAGRFFEDLHLDLTDIFCQPQVENRAQKGAEGLRVHRALADAARDTFDQRQKAQVFHPDGGEESVYLQGEHDVMVINYAENINRHLMLDEVGITAHGCVMAACTLFSCAVQVMDFFRAVKAQTHRKPMFCKKAAPGVGEQGAVGLHTVGNALVRWTMLLLQLHNTLEVVKA